MNLVTFVVTQFAMGITVLIARYLGEKRPEQIGSVMQAPKEAVELTSVYVRICGGGIFVIIAYNLLSAIFRGLGDSKSPLLFVLVACIVNVIGDMVLVAGFHMDAAGALMQSMASFVSQNIGAGKAKRAKKSMFTGSGVGLVVGCMVFALVMLKGDMQCSFDSGNDNYSMALFRTHF